MKRFLPALQLPQKLAEINGDINFKGDMLLGECSVERVQSGECGDYMRECRAVSAEIT
jgi:hypothetical protein